MNVVLASSIDLKLGPTIVLSHRITTLCVDIFLSKKLINPPKDIESLIDINITCILMVTYG